MKKAKRNIIISVALLVVAVVLATSSTYAWFAMTDTPSVENFDLNVTSQEGLYVSATKTGSYGMSITATQLAAANAFAGVKLDARTPSLNANVIGNGTLTLTDLAGTAKDDGYYTFDVYFLSRVAYKIYANNSTAITTKTASSRKALAPRVITAADALAAGFAETEIAQGAAIDAEAANAARIAFSTDDKNLVYDLNSGKGWSATTNSKDMAHEIYAGMGGTLSVAQKTEGTDVLTAIDSTSNDNQLITTLVKINDGEDNFNYFQDGGEVYGGKVTVTIWLEGKDGDCFESIYNDIMTIAVSFLGKYVA